MTGGTGNAPGDLRWRSRELIRFFASERVIAQGQPVLF
jgi:hypothetical protein